MIFTLLTALSNKENANYGISLLGIFPIGSTTERYLLGTEIYGKQNIWIIHFLFIRIQIH